MSENEELKPKPATPDPDSVSQEPATPVSPGDAAVSVAKPSKVSVWGSLQTMLAVAIVMATLFTMWNPANLFSNQLFNQSWKAVESYNSSNIPTSQVGQQASTSVRVGIVAGHYSTDPNLQDPGAVCPDGLTEEQVNYDIAYLVYQKLQTLGYQVDLLQEWDPALRGYQAAALVSIHNDTCEYINDKATGFKVASAIVSAIPENDTRLTDCLIDRYQKDTGMKFHYNSITSDMTQYHNFYEVNSQTPAAIIETGFLNLDRVMLTEHKDIVAQGIVDGILCYINNETVTPFQPTP
jgi:N-acetylmuramoyl-L-alanine amidase